MPKNLMMKMKMILIEYLTDKLVTERISLISTSGKVLDNNNINYLLNLFPKLLTIKSMKSFVNHTSANKSLFSERSKSFKDNVSSPQYLIRE